MKCIIFQNPAGLAGRFTTVRLGFDWTERVAIGEEIELNDARGKLQGIAKVADFWVGDLAVIPASLLEISHDPLARTYSGLVMALRTFYGDEIVPESKVTCIVLDFLRESQLVVPQ